MNHTAANDFEFKFINGEVVKNKSDLPLKSLGVSMKWDNLHRSIQFAQQAINVALNARHKINALRASGFGARISLMRSFRQHYHMEWP